MTKKKLMTIFALESSGRFSGGPEKYFSTREKAIEYLMKQYGNYRPGPGNHFMVEMSSDSRKWEHCYRIDEVEVL